MKISTFIKEKRKLAGLSQDQLANLSGTNRISLIRFEKGTFEPKNQLFFRICKVLELTENDLNVFFKSKI